MGFHYLNGKAVCSICGWEGTYEGEFPGYLDHECIPGNKPIWNQQIQGWIYPPGTPQDGPPGWGDQLASGLESIGITKERVSAWLGHPCNCPARQEKLNKLGRWVMSLGHHKDKVQKEAEEIPK